MSLAALALVLGSAAVHALWNALLADSEDTHATTAVMLVAGVVLFAPVAALTWDVDGEAIPYVLASGATIVLYDGSPFHPDGNALFSLADATAVSFAAPVFTVALAALLLAWQWRKRGPAPAAAA